MEERLFYDINDLSVHPCMRGARYAGSMDKEVMAKNLLDFQIVMKKHKIPFVLLFGTLLGAVREGDFISYDTDADVGILSPQKHYRKMSAVKTELKALGFYMPNKDEIYHLNDWFVRNGERIEVFWFVPFDKECLYTADIRCSQTYLTDIIPFDFLGMTMLIPKQYVSFLCNVYGKNWETPIKGKKGILSNPPVKVTPKTLAEFETELQILNATKRQLRHTINHLKNQLKPKDS